MQETSEPTVPMLLVQCVKAVPLFIYIYIQANGPLYKPQTKPTGRKKLFWKLSLKPLIPSDLDYSWSEAGQSFLFQFIFPLVFHHSNSKNAEKKNRTRENKTKKDKTKVDWKHSASKQITLWKNQGDGITEMCSVSSEAWQRTAIVKLKPALLLGQYITLTRTLLFVRTPTVST